MLRDKAHDRSVANLKNQPHNTSAQICAVEGRSTKIAADALGVGSRTVDEKAPASHAA